MRAFRGPHRSASFFIVGIAAILTLTSCSSPPGENDMKPSQAKKSIVEIVERSADAIGGDWQVYSGPAVEICGEDAPNEVRYSYTMERPANGEAAPESDIRKLKDLWEKEGLRTFDYRSGGSDPFLGVRGKGGRVTTVGFDALPGGYTITGTSTCAPGNLRELREQE